jgi:hypothetical protein
MRSPRAAARARTWPGRDGAADGRGQPHNRQLRAWDGPWSDPKAADLLVPERLVGEEGDHHGGTPAHNPVWVVPAPP